MKIDYRSYLRHHVSTIISVMVIPLMAVLVVFALQMYLSVQTQSKELDSELKDLRSKKSVIEVNESLTSEQIDQYNQLLNRLIPENEDYFSIIGVLETLSRETGFTIVRYTINVGVATADRMSLLVEGDGDSDAFLKLLRDYRYLGGRLITNENIAFTSDLIGKIKMTLNFYHHKSSSETKSVVQVSPDDIKLMKEIQGKIAIQLTPDTTGAIYEVTDNPF